MNALYLRTELRPSVTVAKVRSLLEQLKDGDGPQARVWFKPADLELIIVLAEPASLQDAPPGSHDYARGWIDRQRVFDTQRILSTSGQQPYVWAPCDYDPINGVRKIDDVHAFSVT